MEDPARTDDKLATNVKKLLAVILYLIVLFFLAPTIPWVIFCFEKLLVPAPEPVIVWLKWSLVFSGVVVLCFQLGVMWLLAKFVPLRAMSIPFGSFVFWTCWTVPFLSLGIAAASVIATACGVEITAAGGSDWDWD